MPDMPEITVLEHTADYFVEISGKTLQELFRAGMWAVTSYCTDGTYYGDIDCVLFSLIEETADSLENLFIAFLNEMLFLMTETSGVYYRIDFDCLTEHKLQATIWGVDKKSVPSGGEIKAATYHNLSIGFNEEKWNARILFDV